ncbi:hypothetical protein FT643_00230 [Ketobacter sp. MCCC 1A13808]|uniref:DAPG hydrolase family protein n=1 Tax=Ketobacter sp. MCCC 1A13808 TaxID=2602738 RepID=UPI000F24061A|nr:hypothetical protein [Ketobacter sp. MCCC 1A13808]MVF10560.1 hypothetical protein [Ketobacter sp. MCCC 1A13808]RLP55987.1 MAG: hypothetical protein D6160_00855 [Ketobacter sp.]
MLNKLTNLIRKMLVMCLLPMSSVLWASVGQLDGFTMNGYKNRTVIEQEIKGISPEMLEWWWDNINTTERYALWHSTHTSFEWLNHPAQPNHLDYSIGASYLATNRLADFDIITKVTRIDPSVAEKKVEYEHWMLSEIEFEGYDQLTNPGWILYEFKANEATDGIVLRTSFKLPNQIGSIFPGYSQALALQIREKMQNLADFLPALFQQEFIEGELLTRGSVDRFVSGFLVRSVIVDQEIKGITPDMLDWWWDNINTTSRYKRWHPTAHVSFEWLTPPSQPGQLEYSVGAVQLVSEYLGKYRSNLLITWLDPTEVADDVTYDHWVYAKTDLKELRGIFPQRMIHEYTLNNTGDGIFMRSRFTVPTFLDWVMPGFSKELGKHAQQEMQMLQYFLPDLFAKEYLKIPSANPI